LPGWHEWVLLRFTPPAIMMFALEGRSVTLVAAYIMYTQHKTPEEALELIRQSRPNIEYVAEPGL
jgi:hypothetical protein